METHDQDFFSGKTVLITGGFGFIGASLSAVLEKNNNLYLVSRENKATLSSNPSIHHLQSDYSVAFWESVLPRVDIIYHFAAQTSSVHANAHPAADLVSNALPMASLVEACQLTGKRPMIIIAGAVTQVGLTAKIPINEKVQDGPVTLYDIHKLTSEMYVSYYATQIGGAGVTLRLANVYGPGPTSSSADRGILNLMVRKALRGENLTVYGTGEYIRDYVYIDDVVRAFLLAGSHERVTSGKHYVIGSGSGHTIVEMVTLVAQFVADQTGKKVRVMHIPEPAGLSSIERRHFVADTSAFEKDTGWKATVDLASGISKTIEFYYQNTL